MPFTDHFRTEGEAVAPQRWMQLRQVASNEAASVSKTYDPNDGWSKDDALQSVQTSWTNDTVVSQWVYGMVTKSGSQVTLQCRSRGYLSTSHGVTVGAAGAAVNVTEVSRFGVGTDLGNGGLLAIGGAFGISELRQNSTTLPLMPQLTGWFQVQPGETITARVEVKFVSEFWENTQIDGGESDTESKVITGDVRLDLFALPTMSAVRTRALPTIVGGNTNVRSAVSTTTNTTVTSPTGLTAGDSLLAIVCNQYGLRNATTPVEGGWSLLHSRSASDFLGLLNGVNARVFIRRLTGSPAANYSFTNSFGSEQIAVLIGLRNTTAHDATEGLNWYVSSDMARFAFFDDLSAPSVNRSGQALLAFSYFSHLSFAQAVTQNAPTGMTKVGDYPGTFSTLGIALLNNPPVPTQNRRFTPVVRPSLLGYAIQASILIPGTLQ